ncbi:MULTISPECIES: FemAB family XrtA/PEP-CTERM system-associated protein [unclassified Sphingomonas]|uniref:FemAB family XrtA/PEP-CTERM system-associated protein n=1 Tax=unclassified Sphingomonas TaxID=196159 RepID=UPI00285E319B|nr:MULTISPECIES: FemAB family XrtA/PEP-CTERM system-associated protein [unclassified Sphingomonas]MDR6115267.1 FemAB-related protein (PEP-CTERM system-associated) [Sphingomonas sp. SORGH_AS_0789]MDR6151058.1 FemAB-related protein (PEP-CTERM system-associated) [Sphingomonas sp. SORGH_AS_0742]
MSATVPILRVADLARETERARIDAFVDAAGGTPFHRTGWLLAGAAGCGQKAHCLVAERSGDLVGLLPLSEIRSPLFGAAMVSTGFGVDGGVLGEGVDLLAEAAWTLARDRGIESVELRGGPVPDGWTPDADSYLGFVRPIAADDEAELKAIPRKQRAEVRKALANELTVQTGADAAMLAEHYRVYAESVRNLGTPVFPARLFREAAARLDADVLTVRHRGRAVASVLSLYHGGTVYPYWGGGTQAARGLRANDLMYFALMRHARTRGCHRFDFGRSKVGTGAAAFKKNWGFEGRPLVYASRSIHGPRAINPLNPKYAAMIAIWKRMPVWAARIAGPMIARGLG